MKVESACKLKLEREKSAKPNSSKSKILSTTIVYSLSKK